MGIQINLDLHVKLRLYCTTDFLGTSKFSIKLCGLLLYRIPPKCVKNLVTKKIS